MAETSHSTMLDYLTENGEYYDTTGKKRTTVSSVGLLEEAYESGDFTDFVPLLDENCVYESMWVLEPLCGREAVANHLLGKGRSIRESNAFPRCSILQLMGSMNAIPNADVTVNGEKKRAAIALAYEPEKYCLMMQQTLDGETNEVLLDLKLTADGLVSRIDLCMPELFNTSGLCPHVILLPANGEEENEDALIRISFRFFDELNLFLGLADQDFDEFDNMVIPMENWVKTLEFWKEFAEADDYDAIAEKFAGIDYANWSFSNKFAMNQLFGGGTKLWQERKDHAIMLHGLLEWTQKYKDSYDCIHTCGF